MPPRRPREATIEHLTNVTPHEFAQFSALSKIDCAECTFPRDHPIHAVHMELVPNDPEKGHPMQSLSTDDIELALSLGVDPEDSGPLSDERRKELEAVLNGPQPESEHENAVGAAVTQDAIAAAAEQIMAKLAAAQGGSVTAQGGVTPSAATAQSTSFEAILKQIDPRDSEAALAMLEWLHQNGRMQVIGNLAGGGYLWHYAEPKGTSKQGYVPGGTKGGRMVDEALDKARASGATPAKRGMCDKCFSVVVQHDDGTVTTDDANEHGAPTAGCSAGGTHNFNA